MRISPTLSLGAVLCAALSLPAQAGVCADLQRFLAAADEKPAFASLDPRIAEGQSLGYVKPSAEWGMPEARSCAIAAPWLPEDPDYRRGASLQCDLLRGEPKSQITFDQVFKAREALDRTLAACPALSGWAYAAPVRTEPGSPRYKESGTWTDPAGRKVMATFERRAARRTSSYVTYLRIELPMPE